MPRSAYTKGGPARGSKLREMARRMLTTGLTRNEALEDGLILKSSTLDAIMEQLKSMHGYDVMMYGRPYTYYIIGKYSWDGRYRAFNSMWRKELRSA